MRLPGRVEHGEFRKLPELNAERIADRAPRSDFRSISWTSERYPGQLSVGGSDLRLACSELSSDQLVVTSTSIGANDVFFVTTVKSIFMGRSAYLFMDVRI